MRWSIDKKTAAGLAVAGLILLIVASLSYRNGRWIHRNNPETLKRCGARSRAGRVTEA
jgi:hypothetical protein